MFKNPVNRPKIYIKTCFTTQINENRTEKYIGIEG